jgi:hypothetical protein
VRPLLKPEGKKYFGAALDGAPKSMDPVKEYTQQVGKQPNMVEYYAAWGDQFDPQRVRNAWDAGAMSLQAWEPFTPSLKEIAGGASDAYIKKFAMQVRDLNLPLAISFGHEMNGDWFAWGTKNPHEDFVKAWQHIHDVFQEVGALNVIWVWSPNVVNPAPDIDLKPLYPGDQYVDWIGLVGYYTSNGSSSFKKLFEPTINAVRTFTAKPVIISETGAEQGKRKSADIKDFFTSIAASPDVIGFVWFNYKKRADWRVDSDQASLAEFKRQAAGPSFGFDVRKP